MPDFENKICDLSPLSRLMEQLQSLPHPVVMTNGVFDLLHRGHVTYLAQARALGASLVVAVNTDASVRRLGKGEDRPINACADRMAVLAALESVSMVLSFDDDTALQAVQLLRPDIYVKGGDYDMHAIPEGQAVLAYGGQVRAIDFEHDRSTTKTLQKLTQKAVGK
jgi:rfaE bifunctional protein nucleotidyltransferase chain/domain